MSWNCNQQIKKGEWERDRQDYASTSGLEGDIFSSRLRKFGRTEMCTRRCFYQDVVVCTVPVVVNCVQISVPSTFSHSAFFFFFWPTDRKPSERSGKLVQLIRFSSHTCQHMLLVVSLSMYMFIYTHTNTMRPVQPCRRLFMLVNRCFFPPLFFYILNKTSPTVSLYSITYTSCE